MVDGVTNHHTSLILYSSDFQDPGEIRLFYCLHPGNIVMIAGIIMIAFLINANLCGQTRSCKMKFLLNVLYLSSFALHYGMVLWMSFVRGKPDAHLVSTLLLFQLFNMVFGFWILQDMPCNLA